MTNATDALWIAALGVEAVGLNFCRESPRFVSLEEGAAIASALPPGVLKVGVFRDAPGEEVDEIAALAGLDRIQLHGSESPEYAARRTVRPWKVLRPGASWTEEEALPWRLYPVLVDAYDPLRAGGTGKKADWQAARRLVETGYEVILAGGLGPGNLKEAVRFVNPVGVDLNSGVESAPGRKSKDLLRRALRELGRTIHGSSEDHEQGS